MSLRLQPGSAPDSHDAHRPGVLVLDTCLRSIVCCTLSSCAHVALRLPYVQLVNELYHEDKGFNHQHCVFLNPRPPGLEQRHVLAAHHAASKMHYLQGSPFRTEVSDVKAAWPCVMKFSYSQLLLSLASSLSVAHLLTTAMPCSQDTQLLNACTNLWVTACSFMPLQPPS